MATLGGYSNFTNLALALSALWEENLRDMAAISTLYNVLDSQSATERRRGLGNMSLVPKYNGTIEYDEPGELALSTYVHDEFARGIRIGRSLIDDDEYGIVAQMVQGNAEAFNRTQAYHMKSVFDNAFSSTYAGPDGQALCATTGRSTGKKSQANKGTSALTHDAVTATITAMQTFKDLNGLQMMVQPDTLVVPAALRSTALEITQSVLRSDNANNAINANNGINVIVEPLLTDANNWFMVDSALARQYLTWFWRVRPEFAEDPTSDFSLEMKMRGYMRFSYGWDTHVWVYGHEVA